MEIIRLVEQSNLSVRQTLNRLGIGKSTFYNWLKRLEAGGMDALIEANKTAAAGYQDLFKKQLAAFEATVLAAKDHAETMGSGTSQSTVENQGEFVKSALENAMANMTALAQDAQKANVDAYAVVAERVEENVRELQELARKFTGS